MAKPRFQPPKGTRDLYPEDMLRRRYITQAWRDTSIRHGFEEIDGPTFETSDLYAVKSGDGILGELFQAFSGKDPKDLEFIKEHDRAQLALRPEFTPTLARLYAARAAQLPKPTKWFSIGPFFRAERPQRGRLREFLQWNVDCLGDESPNDGLNGSGLEAEEVCLAIAAMTTLGIDNQLAQVHFNSRAVVEQVARLGGANDANMSEILTLLDRRSKLTAEQFMAATINLGMQPFFESMLDGIYQASIDDNGQIQFGSSMGAGDTKRSQLMTVNIGPLVRIKTALAELDVKGWAKVDGNIVRGLAYYTGTVFEVIAEGERAVAGGGRYDNLIELLGGPPTPAVGFAMGDVVLSLLLEDKGLMPEGPDLLEACSRPPASLRPEAFVVTPDEALDPAVRRLVADLRRGAEREGFEGKPWASDRYETRPLHARRSYKSTRNIGKLIKDATSQHSKTLVIIENEEHATVQDLDRKDKHENITLADVPAKVAELT